MSSAALYCRAVTLLSLVSYGYQKGAYTKPDLRLTEGYYGEKKV